MYCIVEIDSLFQGASVDLEVVRVLDLDSTPWVPIAKGAALAGQGNQVRRGAKLLKLALSARRRICCPATSVQG